MTKIAHKVQDESLKADHAKVSKRRTQSVQSSQKIIMTVEEM
jgi:hypothetical protein